MLIDKKEFEKRLKEDKFFEDFNKQYEYRFPVVEAYCFNTNIKQGGSNYNIILHPAVDDHGKRLVVQAFYSIKRGIEL